MADKPNFRTRTKAVVFDFDGTLAVLNIDFGLMRKRVLELMERYGVKEEAVGEKYLLEMIDQAHHLLSERKPSEAEVFVQEAHRILHAVEMKAAEKGELIPGTERMLKALRGRGIKVGIVTRNCEEAVRRIFPQIDGYCDVFVSRDTVKKVKPHPDHLDFVLKSFHVAGKEAVMVGDHPIDVEAGKGAGMETIGVLTGRTGKEAFEKAGADVILTEASEIQRLLEGEER